MKKVNRVYFIVPVILILLSLSSCGPHPLSSEAVESALIKLTNHDTDISALQGDNLEAIKESVEKGVDINQEIWGNKPLYYAIHHGRTRVIAYIIEQGAELNYRDMDGFAPLNYGGGASVPTRPAAISIDEMDLMLRHGADINITSREGLTTLDYAIVYGWAEEIFFLLDRGAAVNDKTWRKYLKYQKDINYRNDIGAFYARYSIRKALMERYFETEKDAESGYSAALNAAILGDSAGVIKNSGAYPEDEKNEIVLYAAAF
jgi:hypothetical protein